MQARPFEEAAALARFDPHVQGFAVAIDGHRHFDAGLALRPDAAKEAREIAHVLAGHREHNVAGVEVRFLGRPAIGEADNDESVLDFGRVKAEPRSRRRAS